jgi:hypothetical protein
MNRLKRNARYLAAHLFSLLLTVPSLGAIAVLCFALIAARVLGHELRC